MSLVANRSSYRLGGAKSQNRMHTDAKVVFHLFAVNREECTSKRYVPRVKAFGEYNAYRPYDFAKHAPFRLITRNRLKTYKQHVPPEKVNEERNAGRPGGLGAPV